MPSRLICSIALLLGLALAQLSKSQQDHLRQLADDELLKGDSLRGIAQAGQVLSHLNQLNEYSSTHGCRSANKLLASADLNEPSSVYYRAEIFRFMKCDSLKNTKNDLKTLLGSVSSDNDWTVDDYYFLYLLATHLTDYGLTDSLQLKNIKDKKSQDWFDKFDARNLSIIKFDPNNDRLPTEGLTLEGLKMLEMQSSFVQIES